MRAAAFDLQWHQLLQLNTSAPNPWLDPKIMKQNIFDGIIFPAFWFMIHKASNI